MGFQGCIQPSAEVSEEPSGLVVCSQTPRGKNMQGVFHWTVVGPVLKDTGLSVV